MSTRPKAMRSPPSTRPTLVPVPRSRSRRFEEAIEHHHRALALRPDNIEGLIRLGSTLLEHGNPGAAEGCFRRAAELDGDRAEAWSLLGTALNRQHRDEEALEAFARAEQ